MTTPQITNDDIYKHLHHVDSTAHCLRHIWEERHSFLPHSLASIYIHREESRLHIVM